MSKFECHITVHKPKFTRHARLLFAAAAKGKMKTSWITGDPVLGAGKWFYISGYSESYLQLLENMTKVADDIRSMGFEVIREKLEQIMYDTKTGHFECGVDCTACLDV